MENNWQVDKGERYVEMKILGFGGYGKVFLFKDMQSGGECVAIKKIELDVTL